MKDVKDYTRSYINKQDLAGMFEQKYQVKYRQKSVGKSLKKYKHAFILEVGCAMDSQAKCIPDMDEYVIVEPSHEFIEKAKTDLEGKNIHYVEGFLEDNIEALKKWSYDFIIVGSLLHELKKPALFLERLKCLCSNETVIHVNVPNAKSVHRILAEKSGLIKDVHFLTDRNRQFYQYEVFDMKTLCDLLEKLGGKILDSGSYFVKPFTHEQMMSCIREGIINEQILDGLDKLAEYIPEYGSEIYVNFHFV